MKYFTILSIAIGLLATANVATAQKTEQEQNGISRKIAEKRFTFVARTVMPMRGISRQLSSLYDLRISGDSVIADLPYFGRAYSAPINMSGGGIHFTSVNNSYTVKNKSKGGWDITIKPGESNDVREMNLSVFPNGNASLRVTSTSRDPISFSGSISSNR